MPLPSGLKEKIGTLEILIKVKITISCDLQEIKVMSSIHEAIKKTYSSLMEHGNYVATSFSEEDFRGERFIFAFAKRKQRFVVAHQPQAIKDVHAAYFEAGADIVETNTRNHHRYG
jgi:hypothetical protein